MFCERRHPNLGSLLRTSVTCVHLTVNIIRSVNVLSGADVVFL